METELDLFSDPGTRSPLALPMGYVLDGRYKLGRVLGVGGFGITYAGQTMDRLPVEVAIKEFLPSSVATRTPGGDSVTALTEDRQESFHKGLEAFVDEARMLTAFREEPNIVTVIRFVEANGTAYLVMPYYRGRSLSQLLAQQGGTIHVEEAVELMQPVLRGLSTVHGAGLLHRDIKPDNVYLTDRRNVLLLDFGAAREFVEDQTASHTRILSRGYAPPEQYERSTRHGPWIDVYAAAATLYRCITGVVPPEGTLRRFRDELEPASALATVPQAFSAVLAKGLDVDYKERYQTAEAFRVALQGALSTVVLPPEPPPELPPEPPMPPTDAPERQQPTQTHTGVSRNWRPVALAAVGVVVLVLAAWGLWGRGDEPDIPTESVSDAPRETLYRAAVVAEGPDGYLSVRTLPTLSDGASLARLNDRARLDVLGCEDEQIEIGGEVGSWCEVRIPPQSAWMVADDIALGVSTSETSRLVSVERAPVYARADAGTETLALSRNRSVRTVECEPQVETIGDRQGRWCGVSVGPYEGWAFGGFLRALGDSTDATFRQTVEANPPNPRPFRRSAPTSPTVQAPDPSSVEPDLQRVPAPAPEPQRTAPTPPAGTTLSELTLKPKRVTPTSTVVVDYIGRLDDGSVFENQTGAELPLGSSIVGLRNGLVGMQVGERKRIVVPPLEGYGVRGLPGRGIPPAATLTFDVTLREIR